MVSFLIEASRIGLQRQGRGELTRLQQINNDANLARLRLVRIAAVSVDHCRRNLRAETRRRHGDRGLDPGCVMLDAVAERRRADAAQRDKGEQV